MWGWIAVICVPVAALMLSIVFAGGNDRSTGQDGKPGAFIVFLIAFGIWCISMRFWAGYKAGFVPPEPSQTAIQQQKPYGAADYATTDDLRRGGFIE